MTLCIVSHSATGHVIALADRLVSRDPHRHQPPTPKGYTLHKSIYCLYAGGISNAAEIIARARVCLANTYGDRVCMASNAAHVLRDEYEKERILKAGEEILPGYGLSGIQEYQDRYGTLKKKMVDAIKRELREWTFPDESEAHFLIFGHDLSGPHIYRYAYNRLENCDAFGFASIGWSDSTRIADTLLHDRQPWIEPFGAALMLAYVAARRAVNTDAGVGPPEDILLISNEKPEEVVQLDQLGMMRLNHVYDATMVRGLGGIQMAIQFAHQFMPDENLGIKLPGQSDPGAAPQPPQGSSDGP